MTEETPNLRLRQRAAGDRNWSDDMNNNLSIIDAVVSAYFTVQNLQGIWQNSTVYAVDDTVVDEATSVVYKVLVAHTSASIPTTFAEDRAAHSTYWGVYSSPARSRGAWEPNTAYALNDFVVNSSQYAICIETHTSSLSFADDVVAGKWSILVDLSTVGDAVMPVPSAADANKFSVIDSAGAAYTLISAANALTALGGTSIGLGVFQATTEAAARAAIGAQVAGTYVTGGPYQLAGSYQTLNASLTTLSGKTIGTYGLTVLAMSLVADLKTSLGLGTAAYLDVGTTASKVVQLTAAAKLPAVDGSLLTNLPLSLYALLASPALTGTPTAPTAVDATDTTQIATTEFVHNLIGGAYSAASPGYITLQGGIIVQWGTTTSINAGAQVPITFPLAFPSSVFIVVANANATFVSGGWSTSTKSVTGFIMFNDTDVSQTFDWMTVGH